MVKSRLPKISIIIMSFNGGEYLRKALLSVRNQDYPQELVEIVVVDDASQDNSVEIAKSFGSRVFISGKQDMYLSWAIALHKVTGELVYMIDQDIELRGRDFFKKIIKPFLENAEIIATFTRAYPRADQPWIVRFISYQPFQCDPLYEYISPPVEGTFQEKREGYIICKFTLGKIPAESRMMYRMSILKKTPNWKMDRIFDHDLLLKTIKTGYDLIAYVPSAGIYHHHATSLVHLLKKRVRNLQMHYFPYNDTLEYRWVDTSNKKEVIRMIAWVIYANLFFPELLRGFFRFIKHKDWALLMQPVVAITTTDLILWNFITSSVGKKIIKNSFLAIFK